MLQAATQSNVPEQQHISSEYIHIKDYSLNIFQNSE